MDRLNDKLDLIRNEGFTEEQAERIVNAPPIRVDVPDRHSTEKIVIMVVAVIVVLVIVIMLFMILKHYNDVEPWRVCDRWVNNQGDEYMIYGFNPDTRMAKGIGKKNGKSTNFLLQHKPRTQTFYSSLDPGVAVLSGDKLIWGQDVWQREVLYY